MSANALYQQKRMTPSEAIGLVRDGDIIWVPTGVGEPPTLLAQLSQERRRFHDVQVAQTLPLRKFDYFDPATAQHVRHLALFFGAASRPGGQEGWIDFVPNYFYELPHLIGRGFMRADVLFSMASEMDADGYFSLGLAADYSLAAAARSA